ncbi:hypothetical protein DERP_011052, partial [Dermatophagoides pteronyssinus]
MIEHLNTRRMIAVIVVLILLCIIIVILEETITDNVDPDKIVRKRFNQPTSCLNDEPFVIQTRCTLCSLSERTNHIPYCISTGYKEQIYCQNSGQKIWQSCDSIISMFYMFELFMLLMSIVFTFYVRKRQSLLNRAILSRIEKQISSVDSAFELACMDKCLKTRRCKKYGTFTVDYDCDKQCKKKCYK